MEADKMRKMAGILDKIFKVLQSLITAGVIAGLIVVSVCTVVFKVNPDAVIGEGFCRISVGSVQIEVAPEYAPDNSGILAYSWIAMVLGAVSLMTLWFGIKYLRKILEPMKEGNPFHADTASCFRKLAWIVLLFGIIRNAVQTVMTYAAVHIWHLDILPVAEGISNLKISAGTDCNFLFLFAALLLMSCIFRYGASLQKLSDETL